MQQTEEKRQSIKENLRLFRLDALFQNGAFYTLDELEHLLNVSSSTLNRDIKKLRENYNAPLVYDKTAQAYHYSSTLYKLPAVFATEEEMPAYSFVLKLFSMFKDTPLYLPLINICEAFESPIKTVSYPNPKGGATELDFETKNLPEKQWYETRIVMANRATDTIDSQKWEVILNALKNNLKLKFDYETVNENRKSFSRMVAPWQLIFDRGQWYITGMATRHNADGEAKVRTFVVPRMKNIELTTEHFKLPSENEWMIDKYAAGTFGVATEGTKKLYKFIFQRSALYWSQNIFSENQTVEPYTGPLPHDENAVLVSFTSNQEHGIMRDFFAYGADIVPVEPHDFVERWKDKIRQMNSYL